MSTPHRYGRPVTDWSTPPLVSSQSRPRNTEPPLDADGDASSPLRELPLDEEVGLVDRMQELRVEYPVPTQRVPYVTRHLTTAALLVGPVHPDHRHHQYTPAVTSPASTSGYSARTQAMVGVRPIATPPKPPTAMVAPLVGIQNKETRKHSRNFTTSSRTARHTETGSERSRSTTPSPDEKIVVHAIRGSGSLPPHTKVDIDKWKALVETKDRIISQKNQLIERQKQTISRLQQELREEETLPRPLVGSTLQEGSQALALRLQRLEAENSSMAARYGESKAVKEAEIDRLSKKLGATEYELQKTVCSFQEKLREAEVDITDMKKKLQSEVTEKQELEQRCAAMDTQYKALKDHSDKLSRYLGNMPTVEEHSALENQVGSLGRQCAALTRELEDERRICRETQLLLQNKEEGWKAMEAELRESKEQLQQTREELEFKGEGADSLETENTHLKTECQRLQKLMFDSDAQRRHELQSMRDRHRQKFTEATATLRSQYKSMAKRAKALEMQLIRNSDIITALNDELQISQGTIGDLKSSMGQLISQNQGLVEQNIGLQEVSAEAIRTAGSVAEARGSSAEQLTLELTKAVDDLRALVNLCSSLMEGRDPSASVALGVTAGTQAIWPEVAWEGSSMDSKLEQVHRLHEEIEQLRAIVAEQFAAQVSSSCSVQ